MPVSPAAWKQCSRDHEALKRDDFAWMDLEFLGIQDGTDGEPALEYRNCNECRSTLARPVREL